MKTVEKTKQNKIEETRNENIISPDVDIIETPDGFTVFADMPRVDENSVEISLESGVLSLRGKRADVSRDNMRPALIERDAGTYQRSFMVSDGIDHDKISATVKNGMLKIVLPRAEEEKPRKIAVKAG